MRWPWGRTEKRTEQRAAQGGTGGYTDALARALTPALLSLMARDLIRRGEFVRMIRGP